MTLQVISNLKIFRYSIVKHSLRIPKQRRFSERNPLPYFSFQLVPMLDCHLGIAIIHNTNTKPCNAFKLIRHIFLPQMTNAPASIQTTGETAAILQ